VCETLLQSKDGASPETTMVALAAPGAADVQTLVRALTLCVDKMSRCPNSREAALVTWTVRVRTLHRAFSEALILMLRSRADALIAFRAIARRFLDEYAPLMDDVRAAFIDMDIDVADDDDDDDDDDDIPEATDDDRNFIVDDDAPLEYDDDDDDDYDDDA